jgi:hypothetical protein
MAYHEKGIALKCVIAPGNEVNRELIAEIIKGLPNSKKATGKKWLTYYSDPRRVNFSKEKYEDEEEIYKLVSGILKDNKEMIKLVTTGFLEAKDKFE